MQSPNLGNFTLVAKALAASNNETIPEPEIIKSRFMSLGKHILGDAVLNKAIDVVEINGTHLIYTDELRMAFLYGATPEEDFFMVCFLGFTSFRPVRTMTGLGLAIQEIMDEIREAGKESEIYTLIKK